MSTPATIASVHWTQPGLAAINERDGHGDDCGPIICADYVHVTQGFVLDENIVQTMRTQAIGAGLMNTPGVPGMTMTALADFIHRFYYVTPRKVVPWGQVNLDALHADLKAIATEHYAVALETSKAYALPDNQSGVEFHFILAWGLDSDRGYYCCNGDTNTALAAGPGAVVAPVYYSWQNILDAQIGAYAIFPAFTPKPPAPSPDVKGALADLATAQAALADAAKKLEL